MEFASDVLLVADDSSLCKTVNAMLRDHLRSPVPTVGSPVAMQEVARRSPRIVFIQDDLRGVDGIQVGEEILKARPANVVLISRNEARAVDAYAAGIPDFLLTPLQRERLLAALARGLQRTSAIPNWGAGSSQPPPPPLRFKAKRGFVLVRPSEVLWIEAAANYLVIHLPAGELRVRATLAEACARLKEHRQFLRIHRSILINADYLREVRSSGSGDWVVVLRDLRELPVSRMHVLQDWASAARNLADETSEPQEREIHVVGAAHTRHRMIEVRQVLQFPGLLRSC